MMDLFVLFDYILNVIYVLWAKNLIVQAIIKFCSVLFLNYPSKQHLIKTTKVNYLINILACYSASAELVIPTVSEFLYYENTPMQYTAIFQGSKIDNLQIKIVIFIIFLSKT